MANRTSGVVLNTSKLVELLKEKTTTSLCPFCGEDDWSVPLLEDTTGVALPWAKNTDLYMEGSPAVMMLCKRCGFVRLHSLLILSGALEYYSSASSDVTPRESDDGA